MGIGKVGEVELEVLDLPKDIKNQIKNIFLVNGSAGRRNLLKIVDDLNIDPYKFLLKTIYLINVENKSYSEVLKFYKRIYGIKIAKGTLFNLLNKVKNNGIYDILTKIATEKVRRKIKVFYETDGEFKSDIDYIQKFIEARKHTRNKRYTKKILTGISWVVNELKKLPREWNIDELIKLRNRIYEERLNVLKDRTDLTEYEKEVRARNYVYHAYLTPIRQILKFIGKTEYLPQLETKGWKTVYSDIEEKKEYLDLKEIKQVLNSNMFTINEKIFIMLEITTGARHYWASKNAGLFGIYLRDFYEVDNELRLNIREAKTGRMWQGIRVGLLDDLYEKICGIRLENEIKKILSKYDRDQKLVEILFSKKYAHRIRVMHKKIGIIIGRKFTAHFMRHTHATILIRLGIPMELVAGKYENAEFGVGWADLNTLYTFYVALGSFKYRKEFEKLKTQIKDLNL